MDTKKSFPEIKLFVQKVQKQFSPAEIILFGSRAKGEEWKQSDYDFIIVSPKFKNVHWLQRITKLVKLWNLKIDVDLLPYTPEEFKLKKKQSSIVRSALKYGKVISS